MTTIAYKIANTILEFKEAKVLFQQYANSLNIDLSFQNFAEEIESLHKIYNKPKGALILAYKDDITIGCIGIREFDNDTAELKRMFVLPEYRNLKIGRKLFEISIEVAKELLYSKIRLDTLPSMIQAQNLYRTFGFYEIPAYRFNPVKGTIYMEKNINGLT